jgi:hypothetical protein
MSMLTKVTGFGILALAAVLTFVAVAPASAEFFGCNDNQRSYSTRSYPTRSYSAPSRTTTRYSYAPRRTYTSEFAAHSSRRVTYSTHGSSRFYRDSWR